jgi:hypothetical protein
VAAVADVAAIAVATSYEVLVVEVSEQRRRSEHP